MKKLYLLSGLGADRRVYETIGFSGYEPIHIEWLVPEKNESIQHYAVRLSKQVNSENPILIGLSFGGILAIEIAKHIATEKIIIISSVKTHTEIPFLFRFLAPLRLHRLIPTRALTQPNPVLYKMFGCNDIERKTMLDAILNDTDPGFLRWGMEAIMSWRNYDVPKNLTHIHGTADKIFPYSLVHCNITIKDGSHFMVVDKAQELTKVLREVLG